MATFVVTDPQGKEYEVTAPDGASQDEVLAYAQKSFSQSAPAPAPQATGTDRFNAVVAGGNSGLAGLFGLPVDTAENAANLVKAAYGTVATALGAPDRAPALTTGTPGGSQWIRQQLSRLGINTSNPVPLDPAASMLHTGSSILTSAMGGGGKTLPSALAAVSGAVGGQVLGPEWTGVSSMVPAVAGQMGANYAASRAAERQAQIEANSRNAGRLGTIEESRNAGLLMTPVEVNPSATNQRLQGFAGKFKTEQTSSLRNQERLQDIVRQDLQLPRDVPMSQQTLENVRTQAGTAYDAIRQYGAGGNLTFSPDQRLRVDLTNLGGKMESARKQFPEIVGNAQIDQLRNVLNRPMSMDAAIDLVKTLRFQATSNYKSAANPEQAALADAQRSAANAIDGFIERSLSRAGAPQLAEKYKDARMTIAKTYDIEAAMSPAGEISAPALARINQNKDLTGGLRTIANFGAEFPRNAQLPTRVGAVMSSSPLDTAGAGIMATAGNAVGGNVGAAVGAGIPFLRGPMTNLLLSGPYQRTMATPSQGPVSITPDLIGMLLNSKLNQNPAATASAQAVLANQR